MTEEINKIIASLGIEKYTILLEEMSYLVFFLIILSLGIFFFIDIISQKK